MAAVCWRQAHRLLTPTRYRPTCRRRADQSANWESVSAARFAACSGGLAECRHLGQAGIGDLEAMHYVAKVNQPNIPVAQLATHEASLQAFPFLRYVALRVSAKDLERAASAYALWPKELLERVPNQAKKRFVHRGTNRPLPGSPCWRATLIRASGIDGEAVDGEAVDGVPVVAVHVRERHRPAANPATMRTARASLRTWFMEIQVGSTRVSDEKRDAMSQTTAMRRYLSALSGSESTG
jgi:hypothetical protein